LMLPYVQKPSSYACHSYAISMMSARSFQVGVPLLR
jgi:hypothetical protein